MQNNISFLTALALWAGGFDLETARQCTSSEIRTKSILGSTVFIPPLLGFMSFTYAANLVLRDTISSIFCGIAWAIIVFIIDRTIMGYGRPGKTSKLGVAARFLLAIVISLTLAEPITVAFFQDAIDEQQQLELIELRDDVRRKFDTKIEALNFELSEGKVILDQKQQDYLDEIDGSGGSQKRGEGRIARQKKAAYEAELVAYENLKSTITPQIATLEADKLRELAEIESTYARGLLGSLTALHNIKNPIVQFFVWLIRLFFLLVELVPIMMKLSKSGNMDLYYKIIDDNDKQCLAIKQMTSKDRLEILKKEEQLKFSKQQIVVFEKHIREVLDSQLRGSEIMMKELLAVANKRKVMEQQIIGKVKNPVIQKQLLEQLNIAFKKMVATINALTTQSNEFYTSRVASVK